MLPCKFLYLLNAILLQSSVVYMISLYKSESWSRDVFQIMEQNKYSVLFINNSIEQFAEDFQIPIKSLFHSRETFLDSIKTVLMSTNFQLSDENIAVLNKLHLGFLLQKMTLDQISLIADRDGLESSTDENYDSEAFFILEEELCYIARAFQDLNVMRTKVFVIVDPSVAFICTNKNALRTLVVNLLYIASRNIHNKLLSDLGSEGLSQEIVVMANATKPGKVSKSPQMHIIILDTGLPFYDENHSEPYKYDFSYAICTKIASALGGDYRRSTIDNTEFKNLQCCSLAYRNCAKPQNLSTIYVGDVVSVNKLSERVVQALGELENAHVELSYLSEAKLSIVSSIPRKSHRGFRVLLLDADKSMAHQTGNDLAKYGWKIFMISNVEELMKFKEISTIDLVVIDDNTNRKIMASEQGCDLAKCVLMMGHPLATVSLTSSFGQKPSSSYFSGSVSRPLTDKSILNLKKITFRVICDVIISLEKTT